MSKDGMSFERDDFDGLHTSDCSWITAPYFAPDDCDCDPREMLPEHMIADARDGAALRRLRDAGADIDITFLRDGRVAMTAWTDEVDVGGQGDTIAEAADKCREALG